jgi:predicted flap endonuclease-1-like 5' DNA nuclease
MNCRPSLCSVLPLVGLTSLAFQTPDQPFALTEWGTLLVVLGLILLVALALILNARATSTMEIKPRHDLDGHGQETDESAHGGGPQHNYPDTVVHPMDAAGSSADDLTLIEGIGPKITEILNQSGITTFEQLANTDPQQVETILLNAGLSLSNPKTWSEQARLAAMGDWDQFNQLKNELRGGVRQ